MTTRATSTPDRPAPGFLATLTLALWVGVACGSLFGLVDGLVAARIGTADLDATAFAGCLAAGILQYGLVWCAAACLAAPLVHSAFARAPAEQRLRVLLTLGLALGLFLELYWWTRTFVFYGRPALSPLRLGATALLAALALGVAWILAHRLRPVFRPRLAVGVALAVVGIVGALYLRGQSGVLGSRGEKHARNQDLPNILLVVVDALRQDTLGCYGHPRVKSPHIDRLAGEGVLFENAFTQAPFTWTSFGSLLTGKYPRRHGLVKMAPDKRMSPNITLPYHLERAAFATDSAHASETLRDGDYLAATFHTGTLSTGSGLLRGFDVYYEQLAGHDIVIADSPWSVFRSDLLLHIFAQKLSQKAGRDVSGVSRSWLEENGQKRFVAMVHLYSTHTPYDPPAEFRDLYWDRAYTGPVKAFYAQHREAIEDRKVTPTEADVAAIQNLYFAGVSEADANIGELLATLERAGVLDDTLVIVTADHGESLGENGLWEHNHMVQTNLRIPLVMRWPKGLPRSKRVTALVDEIDVVPTVCDLLGLVSPSDPTEPDRRGLIDGTSLLPLVRGTATKVREYSFAENGLFMGIQDVRWKLVVPAELLPVSEWSRGKTEYGLAPVLIDLEHDPEERHDVSKEQPEVVERLVAALRAWDEEMPVPKSDEVYSAREIEETMRRMIGLGYTAGGVGGDSRPKPRPKDKP